MKLIYTYCSILLVLVSFEVSAQDIKRTNVWYFGDSAGVDFNTVPPTVLTNSKMRAIEGCATISDTNGNLISYTNGETIWNKNHQVLLNGTGMFGDYSSTQSSLFVPQPGNDSILYLFTTGSTGGKFYYNLINLNENGGLGKVSAKNILIQNYVCEKLVATYHKNGKDIWVLVKGFGDDKFYAYLLTSSGLKNCPVISTAGSVHSNAAGSNAQGAMKFSTSGKRLAVTQFSNYTVEVFNFDNASGMVQPTPIVLTGLLLPYGIEFSPNEQRIYVNHAYLSMGVLSQFNLAVSNPNSSRYQLDSFANNYFESLQLASNSKVYQSFRFHDTLSVINSPDSIGTKCSYQRNGFPLNGRRNEYSLPNFVSSYFYPDTLLNFTYQFLCPNVQAVFKAKNHKTAPQWMISKQFGSGNWSYSTISFTHTFSDTGTYTVKLLSGSDSISKTVVVGPGQLLYSKDTVVCQKDSMLLQANPGFSCYWWNDTISSDQIYAKASGTYKVSAWNVQGCKLSDSIKVRLYPVPPDPLQKPMSDSIRFCKGTFVQLSPDSGAGFHWQDGLTKATRIIDTAGLFYTQWTDTNTCKRSDTTRLLYYPQTVPQNPLPDTVSFCNGSSAVLQSDTTNTFHWQDGYLQSMRTVDTAGLYIALWNDSNGCAMADSSRVLTFSVTKPTIQRTGDSLFVSGNFTQWQWLRGGQVIGGAIQTKYKATQNGWFKVWGRDAGQCIAISDSLNITNVSVPLITQQTILIYPNPVNNDLYIDHAEGMQYRLLNTLGQDILQGTLTLTTERITFSSLPQGCYLLLLQSENSQVFRYKLLKE